LKKSLDFLRKEGKNVFRSRKGTTSRFHKKKEEQKMSSTKKGVPVQGSERRALRGARKIGAAGPRERILVTVLVRRRPSAKGLSSVIEEIGALQPQERRHLTREEFAEAYGADPAELEKVKEFAHEHGLDVVEASLSQRRLVLSGTVAAFSKAFGVSLARYKHSQGTYRGRTGPVRVPEDLAPIIEGVFGLDNRPQAKPHFRRYRKKKGAARPRATEISYSPPQIAELYDFPAGFNGKGECIAIIELGGGYRSKDLQAYFQGLGISPPVVKARSVDGGHNQPTGNPNGPDAEVMLDIEVAGAVAPGAKIVVYFAPNTDAGFLDAVTAAIHDTLNKPSVVSISWGAAESGWTNQAMQAMEQAFQDAAALGVTVCCAAGDDGSTDGVNDGRLHVDFPASGSYALACGGTRLEASGGAITKETVWNEGVSGGATGGGVSDVFNLPDWQANANVPPSANPGGRIGRGVPDVAGDADPVTGYRVLVDGMEFTIGGTSAVAPLWAGLIALFNQKLGRSVGYLNPGIYRFPTSSAAFHDISAGNNDITGGNGPYAARLGWDACTGWGSPDGAKLLIALS
jgi:kumamolisin